MKLFFTSLVLLILLSSGGTSVQASEPLLSRIDSVENQWKNEQDPAQKVMMAEKEKKSDDKKKKGKTEEITINPGFFISLGVNLLAVFLLIILVYYPGNRKSEQIFTFLLFNVVIFIITYVLNQVKISMGAAFGLFAVFSMLRYRTRSITMKDMTYLFIFIALGLINAVQLRYDVMAILNLFVISLTWALDSNLLYRQEYSKTIQYDKIEMIRPENHQLLIKDLRERTGLNITRFEIRRVNFLRDAVTLTVYYREVPGGIYSARNGQRKNGFSEDI
jgi:hypothetical protein